MQEYLIVGMCVRLKDHAYVESTSNRAITTRFSYKVLQKVVSYSAHKVGKQTNPSFILYVHSIYFQTEPTHIIFSIKITGLLFS